MREPGPSRCFAGTTTTITIPGWPCGLQQPLQQGTIDRVWVKRVIGFHSGDSVGARPGHAATSGRQGSRADDLWKARRAERDVDRHVEQESRLTELEAEGDAVGRLDIQDLRLVALLVLPGSGGGNRPQLPKRQ
ncbi:hypothetical protein HC891_27790, partial [Candidatus Gracilibacteria bacterium]|nr:hypothetical protein [Candidatus Gracilibacteria bacterium]